MSLQVPETSLFVTNFDYNAIWMSSRSEYAGFHSDFASAKLFRNMDTFVNSGQVSLSTPLPNCFELKVFKF